MWGVLWWSNRTTLHIFYFHPYLGKLSNLTNIFQMGWNHQPVIPGLGLMFPCSWCISHSPGWSNRSNPVNHGPCMCRSQQPVMPTHVGAQDTFTKKSTKKLSHMFLMFSNPKTGCLFLWPSKKTLDAKHQHVMSGSGLPEPARLVHNARGKGGARMVLQTGNGVYFVTTK